MRVRIFWNLTNCSLQGIQRSFPCTDVFSVLDGAKITPSYPKKPKKSSMQGTGSQILHESFLLKIPIAPRPFITSLFYPSKGYLRRRVITNSVRSIVFVTLGLCKSPLTPSVRAGVLFTMPIADSHVVYPNCQLL